MISALIRQYVDQAVRCPPDLLPGARRHGMRVAATLMTCEVAAAALNEIGLPGEPSTSYRHVNVHNPNCALRHDLAQGGWHALPGLARHPVWGLNWLAARRICAWLGARLPLAEEWEGFACAGDPDRLYPWGNAAPSPDRANYDEHYAGTVEVGSFAPNALGLYDLAGNLEEWCEDPWLGACERVVKGGAWSKGPEQLRIAARRGKWERLGTTTIGLRPVWDDAGP